MDERERNRNEENVRIVERANWKAQLKLTVCYIVCVHCTCCHLNPSHFK